MMIPKICDSLLFILLKERVALQKYILDSKCQFSDCSFHKEE